MKKGIAQRLQEKIDRTGGPDACWPWLGYKSCGYGMIYTGRRMRKAHALSLELATGETAAGRMACHMCDNPPCCNPAHLYWGTALTNAHDREVRNRRRRLRGVDHGCAKLTAEQVRAIRAAYRPRTPGHTFHALAAQYGIDHSTVAHIIHRKLWAHI